MMIINGIQINTIEHLRDLMMQQQYDFTDHVLLNVKKASDEVDPYVYEKIEQRNASVPLDRICGSGHPNYAGSTWRFILESAERINKNLQEAINNPNYYINHAQHQSDSDVISYVKIKDDYYVEAGNHRTTISKFLLPLYGKTVLDNVTVSEYKIDHELKELYEQLERVIEEAKFENHIILKIESCSVDSKSWINIDSNTTLIPHETTLKVTFVGKDVMSFQDPRSAQTKGKINLLIDAIKLKRSFSRFFSSNPYLKLL
ncbi:MAG: hypothetical protein PHT07_10125 [Paludibacter sp.]|nr:hypothetical protein [Paludibacter sp.]